MIGLDTVLLMLVVGYLCAGILASAMVSTFCVLHFAERSTGRPIRA